MAGGDDTVTDPAASDAEPDAARPETPLLRVVRGNPTDAELAALVGVVASLSGSGAPPPRRVPEWSANHRLMRRTPPHGPQGWRSSGLPR